MSWCCGGEPAIKAEGRATKSFNCCNNCESNCCLPWFRKSKPHRHRSENIQPTDIKVNEKAKDTLREKKPKK